MTHLTEIRLGRSAKALTRDTQMMHRTLAHAVHGQGRLLWALPTEHVLVVQAAVPVRAIELPGVAVETHSAQTPTGYPTGSRVVVSLIGNPTRSPRSRNRVALRMEEWEPWLHRKLGDALDLTDVAVQDIGMRRGVRHGAIVFHRLVAFTALGTVTDSAALDRHIINGVGPAKGYGAGLLLVGMA